MGKGAFRITSFTDLYPPGGGGLIAGREAGRVAGRVAIGSVLVSVTCGATGGGVGAGAGARRVGVTFGTIGCFDSIADTTLVCVPLGASSIPLTDAASRSRFICSSIVD